MQFSFMQATVLLGALTMTAAESTMANGVVVQTSPTDSPEASAEQQNSEQVSCNLYKSTALHNKSLAPCTPYCGGLVNSKDNQTTSVSCLGGQGVGAPVTYKDENGDVYQPGVCRCNLPVLDELSEDLIEAFAVVGEIGCQIFFGTLDAVLEVATLVIPGVGELDAASASMQAAVKLATKVADKGSNAMDFVNGFLNPCGGGTNYTDPTTAANLFTPLIGKGKPGKGTGKPGKPKPSDPAKPSDTNPPAAPSTKASDKPTSSTAAPSSTKATSTAVLTTASSPSSASSSSSSNASSSSASSSGSPSASSSASSSAAGASSSALSKASSTSSSTSSTSSSSDVSSASSTASKTPSASSPGSFTTSVSSASSSGTSSASSASSSSSSFSTSACGSTSTAKPTKAAPIKGRDVYPIPDDCEVAQILDYLSAYDTSSAKKDKLVDTIIPKYMSSPNPRADASIFYVGDAFQQAATHNTTNGKETIASVFHGHSKFPFDAAQEPFKSISANGMQKQWFRATSTAFARRSSGKVFFVYDGDWETAMSRNGQPSIFNTDELPELKTSGKCDVVYQISTALANLWTPNNEPTLRVMGDITGVGATNGELPAKQIWAKA